MFSDRRRCGQSLLSTPFSGHPTETLPRSSPLLTNGERIGRLAAKRAMTLLPPCGAQTGGPQPNLRTAQCTPPTDPGRSGAYGSVSSGDSGRAEKSEPTTAPAIAMISAVRPVKRDSVD